MIVRSGVGQVNCRIAALALEFIFNRDRRVAGELHFLVNIHGLRTLGHCGGREVVVDAAKTHNYDSTVGDTP